MKFASTPAVSPDGTTIAFSGSMTAVDSADIWCVNADGSNLRKLTTGSTGRHLACYSNWSPDGRKLVYTESDLSGRSVLVAGALRIIDVASGASSELVPGPDVVWAYWDY